MTWLTLSVALVLSIGGVWDIRRRVIPNWVPIIVLLLAIIQFALFPAARWTQLAGFLLPAVVLTVTYNPAGLRGGDIKLIAAIGAFTGLPGLLGVLFPAAVLALIWAKWKRVKSVPFAPFLLAGFIVNNIFFKF